ncbi:DUF559 domain-containing protein [Geobacillus stearothermophilus]|nr:DUF559 domain-containing protein [Geobacillus stearothermophilus]
MNTSENDLKTFYFPCWSCGIPVATILDKPYVRLFCPECKDEYEQDKQETLSKYIELKTRVMFERAMRILEKQFAHLYEYKDESEVVLELALKDPEKFGSSHEMVAAMELLRNRVKAKLQQKILRHRVDFLLPELKVVLEIDGYMHDYSKLKDSKRDVKIINELGTGWEVVRIPTKYIEQNVKMLVPAIKEIYSYKQKLRKENSGFIPSSFSERDKQMYKKIFS